MDHICNCPYCWCEILICSDKPRIYFHPLDFVPNGKNDIRNIFFWKNELPTNVETKIVKCDKCSNSFHIELWPFDHPIEKNENKTPPLPCNDYLLLEKIINRSYVLINKVFHAHITNFWLLNTILVFSMFFAFMIIPALISGAIEKLLNDYWLFVTPIIFILLLTSFKRHLHLIHKSLNFEDLPISLHENYKKTDHYIFFKNTSIRCFFFGPHQSKNWLSILSPPILCGIIACIIGFRFFLYFLPAKFTIMELSTIGQTSPHVYSSIIFNIGYLLFHIPFWFTIGTIVWISLITPNYIAKISKNIPLKINPLQDIGGTEIFGDILLKSNVSLGILALGLPAYFIRNQDIFDQTWIYYNIFLLGIFIIFIFFGFFYPLYPIHKKMKEAKLKEINDLITKIDYSKIKNGKLSHDEINFNLLRIELINKISLKNEWPFNLNILIKIFLVSLIPLIQLIISICSLF